MKITNSDRWQYALKRGYVKTPYWYVHGKQAGQKEIIDWLINDEAERLRLSRRKRNRK